MEMIQAMPAVIVRDVTLFNHISAVSDHTVTTILDHQSKEEIKYTIVMPLKSDMYLCRLCT